MGRVGLVGGLAASLLSSGVARAMPLQWLQQMTGCAQISGYEPLLESPVVTYWEDGHFQPQRILGFRNDGTQVQLRISLQKSLHFLVVDYSPFLHGYSAVYPDTSGTGDHDQWVDLPQLTSKLRSGGTIIPKLVLTVRKNGRAIPNAMVMFDSGVLDDSPFTMQANGAGELDVYCYQWPSHTPDVYVMTDDDEFPASVSIDKAGMQMATGSINAVLGGTTAIPTDNNNNSNSSNNSNNNINNNNNNNNNNTEEKSDDPSLDDSAMKDSH